MRVDADRLRDILDAIEAIRSRVGPDRAAFDADAMVRVWCLHHVTIIGEAAAGLSDEIKKKYPGPPWRKVIGMRNAVVHGYFDVDWDIVWTVVERELEPLRTAVREMLAGEGEP
jgi:uncharacterized protein with HEPN domain